MICVSSNNTVAVYKGLTVAVYTVDKSEVNLTRQDLVELINVCSSVTVCIRVPAPFLYRDISNTVEKGFY